MPCGVGPTPKATGPVIRPGLSSTLRRQPPSGLLGVKNAPPAASPKPVQKVVPFTDKKSVSFEPEEEDAPEGSAEEGEGLSDTADASAKENADPEVGGLADTRG